MPNSCSRGGQGGRCKAVTPLGARRRGATQAAGRSPCLLAPMALGRPMTAGSNRDSDCPSHAVLLLQPKLLAISLDDASPLPEQLQSRRLRPCCQIRTFSNALCRLPRCSSKLAPGQPCWPPAQGQLREASIQRSTCSVRNPNLQSMTPGGGWRLNSNGVAGGRANSGCNTRSD